MHFSVVIPYRDTPNRRYALDAVINNMWRQTHPPDQIVLAEEDFRPTVYDHPNIDSYIFVKAKNSAFCKSAAVNAGFEAAICPAVIIQDADVVVPYDYVDALEGYFRKGFEFVKIGHELQRLDFGESLHYSLHPVDAASVVANSVHADFPAGSLAITQEAFLRCGGMDESYVGWGHEDKAFLRVVIDMTKYYIHGESRFVHLWHPIADHNTGSLERLKKQMKEPPEVIAVRLRRERWCHGDS